MRRYQEAGISASILARIPIHSFLNRTTNCIYQSRIEEKSMEGAVVVRIVAGILFAVVLGVVVMRRKRAA
jgi:hypothetical protein